MAGLHMDGAQHLALGLHDAHSSMGIHSEVRKNHSTEQKISRRMFLLKIIQHCVRLAIEISMPKFNWIKLYIYEILNAEKMMKKFRNL